MNVPLFVVVTGIAMGVSCFWAFYYFASVWQTFARGQLAELIRRYEQLSLNPQLLQRGLYWWGVSLLVIFLCVGVVGNSMPIAIVLVGIVYWMPRSVIDVMIRKRSELLSNQLVGASVHLANTVKAGLPLAEGLENICPKTPQPLRQELTRVVRDRKRGRPLKEAIARMRERLDLETVSLFALSLEVSLEQGGRVNEALMRISESLLEHKRLKRNLDVKVTQGRQSVYFLAVFPLFFLGFMWKATPESVTSMMQNQMGQALMAGVILTTFLSLQWARKIMNIKF